MKPLLIAAIGLILLSSCKQKPGPEKYSEQYRPQYHFTPDHNWINDPNGLVYYKGEYHLFYQYNPYGNKWGHMSWGHAISNDLVHWKHLPVAIGEYTDKVSNDSIMIFSGSAVVDTGNTTGFFSSDSGGIVAIYTSHIHKNGQQLRQNQSIAYSTDNGRSFNRYENNPVLDIERKDFRDPKVFWYAPEKKWVMIAVVPDQFKANLYESKDLKSWNFMSEFGPLGDTAKIWECPDLIELPLENDSTKTKWVAIISNSHPQGPTWVGMQYFVGDFDGKKFTAENPAQYPLYLDYGKDFYAGVTFNNTVDGRKIMIGWANNWAYAGDIPTDPWRGTMSLPRELTLYNSENGLRLKQFPVREVDALEGERIEEDDETRLRKGSLAINVELNPENGESGITLFGTKIGYDPATKEVFVDRTKSGDVSFSKNFPGIDHVPARLIDGKVILLVYFDQSIIEVFVNDGEGVITDQVFPDLSSKPVKTFGEDKVYWRAVEMKSVWR